MRVTSNLLTSRAMQYLQQAMLNIEGPQARITTGKRIIRPSDDPIDAVKVVAIKAEYSKLTQYEKNIASALDWMRITSSTLENVVDILDDVDELIATLGHPATSAERQNAAVEVDILIKDLLSAANRKFMGKYVFGGNETLTQPFTANYTGDIATSVQQNPDGISGIRNVRLSDSDTLAVNVPGDRVFQPSGEGAQDDIFQILMDLRTALTNNDIANMSAVQTRLDTAIKKVAADNANVGGSIRTVEQLELRLGEESLTTDARRSRLEDADIAKAMVEYNQAEFIYQAALAVSARILQTSLVNFIR